MNHSCWLVGYLIVIIGMCVHKNAMRGGINMKCEKSFKRILLTRWGMDQLHAGLSYDEVQKEMTKMKRLTIAELKQLRAEQKGN